MNMNLFTYIAMYGILAYSIYIFGKYPIVTSCVIVIVTGWLVLPQAHFETPHIPYHTKIQAISLALLLGVWKRDPNFFGKFRFILEFFRGKKQRTISFLSFRKTCA